MHYLTLEGSHYQMGLRGEGFFRKIISHFPWGWMGFSWNTGEKAKKY